MRGPNLCRSKQQPRPKPKAGCPLSLGQRCPGCRARHAPARGVPQPCGWRYTLQPRSSFRANGLQGCDFLLGERGSLVEAGEDVLTPKRRVGSEKGINGIAIGQHAKDLMHGDASTLHTQAWPWQTFELIAMRSCMARRYRAGRAGASRVLAGDMAHHVGCLLLAEIQGPNFLAAQGQPPEARPVRDSSLRLPPGFQSGSGFPPLRSTFGSLTRTIRGAIAFCASASGRLCSVRAATRVQLETVLEGKGRGLFVGTNPQSHEPWKKPAKRAVESGRAQVFGFVAGSWACSQIQECA